MGKVNEVWIIVAFLCKVFVYSRNISVATVSVALVHLITHVFVTSAKRHRLAVKLAYKPFQCHKLRLARVGKL